MPTDAGIAAVAKTAFSIDEQSHLFITVIDRSGKELLLTQHSKRGGSTVGKGVTGPQTKVIQYLVLVPRSIPISLRVPGNLLAQGADVQGFRRRGRAHGSSCKGSPRSAGSQFDTGVSGEGNPLSLLRTSYSNHKLARRLRKQRPEPSPTLLESVGRELGARPRRSAVPRVVFAGGLTAVLLAAVGAVGGVGYAASTVQDAVKAVKHVFVGQGSVTISGLSAGGDQYRPGFGWGDPNHEHTGPPGLTGSQPGAAAPPAQTTSAGPKAKFVLTSVKVDEQANLWISVVDARGRAIVLTQGMGAKVGSGISGKPTKVIHYQVLVPRAIPLKLRVPSNLVKSGAKYRIRVVATDAQGNKSTLFIPFTG